MLRRGIATSVIAALLLVVAPSISHACQNAGSTPPALTADQARASVICQINQRRKKAGLRKLRPDPRLEAAAQAHSAAMDASNFFAHNSPSGASPLDRITVAGYLAGAGPWGIAENIRWGAGSQGSPRATVAQWMASPPHRRSILTGRYRHMGIGVSFGSPMGHSGSDAVIYTADFGYRR